MKSTVRARFWLGAGLGVLCGLLAVLTVFWRDWIEALTGFRPRSPQRICRVDDRCRAVRGLRRSWASGAHGMAQAEVRARNWNLGVTVPTAVELTGPWRGNEGTLYYVRGLDDGSVTWVGLSNSGFHLGVDHTNVFKGKVSADGKTITGHWADVPRGASFGAGTLSLSIGSHGSPPQLTLVTNTAGTTGGFRTKQLSSVAPCSAPPAPNRRLAGRSATTCRSGRTIRPVAISR